MEILNGYDRKGIEKAVSLLRKGEVVAFPTETVYGLGADATNSYAVAKIFEIKKRPKFDPLIVHIGDMDDLFNLTEEIPNEAYSLAKRFWPGPLTMILKKKEKVPGIVTAGLPTVAVRMPSHPVALELIKTFGGPIAAPSANPFGYMSPTKALHVARFLHSKIELILDGGDTPYGIESTIVSFEDGKTYIHRHGAISMEELSEVINPVLERGSSGGKCVAPGELPYHYAPHRPLRIIDGVEEIGEHDSSYLAFTSPDFNPKSKYTKVLSPSGDMREAAANFFSYLIELDREDVKIIYAQRIPKHGLGKAMMERLEKASKKYTHITY
ncbi:MAG: L-threonylcarbamoyladenylate synthase [Syntrophorhabdaceae bacterium]|nr:L-threonylcarbamoyladenylate synthase [Syntrophorhabdaceae bacterium]